MQWWNMVMLLFIFSWFLQVVLTYFQWKHYQLTVKQMAEQGSGFLGVGVVKRRLGIGSVVILVTDREFVVTNAKELTGVTVFGRFKRAERLIGKPLDEIEQSSGTHSRSEAARKAVQMIKQQVVPA